MAATSNARKDETPTLESLPDGVLAMVLDHLS